ncbi:hypothetical protein [Catenovulum sediminis]|uniref:hypothetical protein n=1 Tax=Catenovulum sediminis TaxID=1740262 RepID=UPI001180EA57|nr:hypothetical protein [Catenovulum sediminis]
MKLFNKTMLVAAMLTALSGCSEEDFKPTEKTAEGNTAPEHGGDIVINLHEKDAATNVYLMGTIDGKARGSNGLAVDKDGDNMQVVNMTTNTEELDGFRNNGVWVEVDTEILRDMLDTGETKTVIYNYEISDGFASVARTLTINVTGEDFAPEAEGKLVGNYTRDAASGSVNLMTGVSDQDGETLVASNVVADASNKFTIPFTLEDNQLSLDIASVKSQIDDGEKVTLKFTYQISDHRFTIDRDLEVNILGVKDVPGAPLFAEYFLTDEVNETANAKVYDLVEGTVDREGDNIIVSDVKVNGSSDLMFGAMLDGTNLKFIPTAFLTEIEAGKTKTFEFTYKVADDQGNVSDGERSLTITVKGVESNIIAQNGASDGFEGVATGDLPASSGWAKFGWEGPELPQVTTAEARSGSNSVLLEKGVGIALNWTAEVDRMYYYAGWFKTADPVTANFVHFNAYGEGDVGRAWWDGGFRPWVVDSTQWNEGAKIFNTFSWGFPIVPKAAFQAFNGPSSCCSTTNAYVDDLRIVDITDIHPFDNNVLVSGAGTFESGELPQTNGEGNILITDATASERTGIYSVSVDTTGKSGYSADIILPVQAGAVKTSGRYVVQLDIHATNAPADAASGFDVRLETANGNVLAFGEIWSNTVNEAVKVVLNTDAASGTPDWENEDVFVRILLKRADTTYIIDNVTLYAIP